MRKVFVTEFVSLDGVMEDPGGAEKFVHGGWTMPYWSDEIGKFKFDELLASDALLLGRVTYQGFAAAWPSRTDESGFAQRMNSLPKYVVSTTLDRAEWNNSHLIKRDIAKEVSKLRQQPGLDIMVAGSSRLVHTPNATRSYRRVPTPRLSRCSG
jgi:dihydrofolate reductase